MAEYHLYNIDGNNRVVGRHTCDAPDDLTALHKAREFLGDYEVEAWQGTRLVARVTKDGTASRPPDSLARTG
jgi:hypothetical protein